MPPKKALFQNTSNLRTQPKQAMQRNNTNQKIRLRRNVYKQDVIQQNLSHMEQQAQKKKLAQEIYYRNKVGQSPLKRRAATDDMETEDKPPVHNRLGNKIRLRRVKNLINTNQVPVKNRINLQRVQLQRHPTKFGMNNDKAIRVLSAQNRLTRIKQGATFVQRSIIQKGAVQRFAQRGIIQQNTAGINQKIRLRRNRPQPAGGAINYTVQVANNNVKNRGFVKHHVNEQLDPALQEEIRIIQNKSASQNIIAPEAIHPIGTGVTAKSLHERFSEL